MMANREIRALKRKIEALEQDESEYVFRFGRLPPKPADSREARGPYREGEIPEHWQSGWYRRLEEHMRKIPTKPSESTEDELGRLPSISRRNTRKHFDQDPVTTKSEIRLDPQGKPEFYFFENCWEIMFDKDRARTIAKGPKRAFDKLNETLKTLGDITLGYGR